MIFASWAVGLLGVLGIFPALLSVMLFDAPGSENQPATRLAAECIVMFPIACLFGLSVGWSVFRQGRERWALAIVCTPLLVILLFVASLAYISVFHGGRLSG
jgi:hypothetical protein